MSTADATLFTVVLVTKRRATRYKAVNVWDASQVAPDGSRMFWWTVPTSTQTMWW